jgi:hypothetical protein
LQAWPEEAILVANTEHQGSRSPGGWQLLPVTARPRGPMLSLVTRSLSGYRWWDVSRQLRALGQRADPERVLAAVRVGVFGVVPPFLLVRRATMMIAAAQARVAAT